MKKIINYIAVFIVAIGFINCSAADVDQPAAEAGQEVTNPTEEAITFEPAQRYDAALKAVVDLIPGQAVETESGDPQILEAIEVIEGDYAIYWVERVSWLGYTRRSLGKYGQRILGYIEYGFKATVTDNKLFMDGGDGSIIEYTRLTPIDPLNYLNGEWEWRPEDVGSLEEYTLIFQDNWIGGALGEAVLRRSPVSVELLETNIPQTVEFYMTAASLIGFTRAAWSPTESDFYKTLYVESKYEVTASTLTISSAIGTFEFQRQTEVVPGNILDGLWSSDLGGFAITNIEFRNGMLVGRNIGANRMLAIFY